MFLYGQLSAVETAKSTGLSQEQFDAIPQQDIVSIQAKEVDGSTLYDVERKIPKSSESEDFAKQILTTVSTLVVAVAGFYFGTRAVAVARSDVSVTSEPIIYEVIEPKERKGKRGGEKFPMKILGKNFQIDASVKLTKSGQNDMPCSDVEVSSTTITCNLQIPSDAVLGEWNLIVENKDGCFAQREAYFNVEE